MLMVINSPTPRLLANEQGFTLIELLVTMLTATVVAGALFAVLNLSTTQTAALSDKVQADASGRTAMTRIANELHSACIASNFTPIQIESTSTTLRFITAYSEAAVIPKAELHEIVWNKAAGTLTDYSAINTGGEWPSFTFPEPRTELNRKKFVLATNVTESGAKAGIFQYFRYATETTEGEALPVTTLETTPLAGSKTAFGLSKEEAIEAASVLISFNAAATSGKTLRNRSTDISTQLTFAFSVPNSETPINDAPCQ